MEGLDIPTITTSDGTEVFYKDWGSGQRRRVAARDVDRQVHVLERPLQRELGREIAPFHLVQLGVGDRRVQRTALDGLGQAGGVIPSRLASSSASATPSLRMDM